jgi:hypothetical protein
MPKRFLSTQETIELFLFRVLEHQGLDVPPQIVRLTSESILPLMFTRNLDGIWEEWKVKAGMKDLSDYRKEGVIPPDPPM